MKNIKTKPEHVAEKKYVSSVICDICKQESKDGKGWDSSDVNINANIGSVYPEADTRTYYVIDCCSACFLDKVKPLIEKTFEVEFREMHSDDIYSNLEH